MAFLRKFSFYGEFLNYSQPCPGEALCPKGLMPRLSLYTYPYNYHLNSLRHILDEYSLLYCTNFLLNSNSNGFCHSFELSFVFCRLVDQDLRSVALSFASFLQNAIGNYNCKDLLRQVRATFVTRGEFQDL